MPEGPISPDSREAGVGKPAPLQKETATIGVSGAAAEGLTPESAQQRVIAAKQVAASFGEIVSLLMRSPAFGDLSLRDLEWLVGPGIVLGQFAVASAQLKQNGAVMPAAAVLWAHVSADVDRRLREDGGLAIKLAPAEWRSGDIHWVVLTVGDSRAIRGLLQQLAVSTFNGQVVNIRTHTSDGRIEARELRPAPASSGPAG